MKEKFLRGAKFGRIITVDTELITDEEIKYLLDFDPIHYAPSKMRISGSLNLRCGYHCGCTAVDCLLLMSALPTLVYKEDVLPGKGHGNVCAFLHNFTYKPFKPKKKQKILKGVVLVCDLYCWPRKLPGNIHRYLFNDSALPIHLLADALLQLDVTV